jgi:hypothetical protein
MEVKKWRHAPKTAHNAVTVLIVYIIDYKIVSSHSGPVAQRLEQGTHNPLVGGSNPSGPTIIISCISNKLRHLQENTIFALFYPCLKN